MTPRDPRNIHTTGNSCKDALPCTNMALKLPWYFYLLMEKPLGRYFQVRSPYYQAVHCNQKTAILVSSRWLMRSEKANIYIYQSLEGWSAKAKEATSPHWIEVNWIEFNWISLFKVSCVITKLHNSSHLLKVCLNNANRPKLIMKI